MTFSAFKLSASEDESIPENSAKTAFTVEITAMTGLQVKLFRVGTSGDGMDVVVSWGDGTSNNYTSYELHDHPPGVQYGVEGMYHTYGSHGKYEITIAGDVTHVNLCGPEDTGRPHYIDLDTFGVSGIRSAIRSVEWFSPTVTSLGERCFCKADRLTGVGYLRSCGNGISIGDYAFEGCLYLTDFSRMAGVFVSSGEGAFKDCRRLRTLAGMDAFSPSEPYSFQGCRSLLSLEGGWGDGFEGVFGKRIFEGCESLLDLGGIPSSLTTLGVASFLGCRSLVDISALASTEVTTLPDKCFMDCPSIASLDGLSAVTAIGDDCFNGSVLLSSFDGTSDVLETVGARNFRNSAFSTFEGSPSGLISVGEECFAGCSFLESLDGLPGSLASIGIGCFRDCYFEDPDTYEERGLSDLTGLAGTLVHELPDYVFCGCGALRSTDIMLSVTKIGAYAFSRCFGMRTLGTLTGLEPGVITKDSVGAFSYMYRAPYGSGNEKRYGGLTSADGLSDVNVSYVPDKLFMGCALLLRYPAASSWTVRGWGESAFEGCRSMYDTDNMVQSSVIGDYDSGISGHVTFHGPLFGKRCFADCSWESAEYKPKRTDIYVTPGPGPVPSVLNGLTFVGGIRVSVDSLYLRLIRGIDVPGLGTVLEAMASARKASLPDTPGVKVADLETVDKVFDSSRVGDHLTVGGWDIASSTPYIRYFLFGFGTDSVRTAYVDVIAIRVRIMQDGPDAQPKAKVEVPVFAYAYDGKTFRVDGTEFEIEGVVGRHTFSTDLWTDELGTVAQQSITVSISEGSRSQTEIEYEVDVSSDGGLGSARESDTVKVFSRARIPKVYDMIKYGASASIPAFAHSSVLEAMVDDVSDDLAESTSGISSVTAEKFDLAAAEMRNSPSADPEIAYAFLMNGSVSGFSAFGKECFDGCSDLDSNGPGPDSPPWPSGSGQHYSGLPFCVTSLPAACFRNSGFSSMSAFPFLSSFGTECFSGTDVVDLDGFPAHVSSVPEKGFAYCESLESIGGLPYGVMIGARAFIGCPMLSTIIAENGGLDVDYDSFSSSGIVSPRNGSFADRFRYSRMASSLSGETFAGTSVESLAYEFKVHGGFTKSSQYGWVDARDALLSVFSSLGGPEITAQATSDTRHGSYDDVQFVMRFRTGSGAPEVCLKVKFDRSQGTSLYPTDIHHTPVNEYIAHVCEITQVGPEDEFRQYRYDEPIICFPKSYGYTDFVGFAGNTSVRLRFFETFRTSQSGSDTQAVQGDKVWLFVGPYRMQVRFLFKADYSATADRFGIELIGLEVYEVERLNGAPSGVESLHVPVFPGVSVLPAGMFTGDKAMKDLSWMTACGFTSIPDRCFSECPFDHGVERTIGYVDGEQIKTKRYVEIPDSVTTIADTAFLDESDSEEKLEAVVFSEESGDPTNKTGFPFGVPEGCTIWHGSERVYPPLPDAS